MGRKYQKGRQNIIGDSKQFNQESNIKSLSFSDGLISLSIIPSSCIHVEANGGYLSFLMAE